MMTKKKIARVVPGEDSKKLDIVLKRFGWSSARINKLSIAKKKKMISQHKLG